MNWFCEEELDPNSIGLSSNSGKITRYDRCDGKYGGDDFGMNMYEESWSEWIDRINRIIEFASMTQKERIAKVNDTIDKQNAYNFK